MKTGSRFNSDGFFQPISMPDRRVVTSAFSYSSARGQFEPFKTADECDCSEDVKHTHTHNKTAICSLRSHFWISSVFILSGKSIDLDLEIHFP